jgi:hypothetical protein
MLPRDQPCACRCSHNAATVMPACRCNQSCQLSPLSLSLSSLSRARARALSLSISRSLALSLSLSLALSRSLSLSRSRSLARALSLTHSSRTSTVIQHSCLSTSSTSHISLMSRMTPPLPTAATEEKLCLHPTALTFLPCTRASRTILQLQAFCKSPGERQCEFRQEGRLERPSVLRWRHDQGKRRRAQNGTDHHDRLWAHERACFHAHITCSTGFIRLILHNQ